MKFSAKLKSAIHRKLVQPFIDLLKQGMSPEKIALTIALGMTLGVTPVIGSTTMLCTLAAVTLRLNLPAILLVNGAVYPLQLTLLIPFLRAGAWLFRAEGPKLTIGQIFGLIRANAWHAITHPVGRHDARAGGLADRRMPGGRHLVSGSLHPAAAILGGEA